MMVLERVLCITAYSFMLMVVCKAPESVEYTQPTSCSSNQFYQISNFSCVECASNQVKANNGICLLLNKCGCVFIGIKFCLFTTVTW